MRFCLLLVFFFQGFWVDAQPEFLTIGVNGLTCSQCTRNVEMKLRKLSFVTGVKMNLQQTNGVLSFKPTGLDPSAIARAVRDAGFSLRFMEMIVDEPNAPDTTVFRIGPNSFRIIPTDQPFLPGQRYDLLARNFYRLPNTENGNRNFRKRRSLLLITWPWLKNQPLHETTCSVDRLFSGVVTGFLPGAVSAHRACQYHAEASVWDPCD